MTAVLEDNRVEILTDIEQLDDLRDAWNLFHDDAPAETVAFDEYRACVASQGAAVRMHVIAWRCDGNVRCIAPFVATTAVKKYSLGRIGSPAFPVRILWLEGRQFLGDSDPEVVAHVLETAVQRSQVDLVRFGALPEHSAFCQSLRSLSAARVRFFPPAVRNCRVIDLPSTFDEYLATIGSNTRYNARRALRTFTDPSRGRIACVTAADDVEVFLRDASTVSRRTYQWKIGEGLADDAATRDGLIRDARLGLMRCYLLSADEQPCGFIYGQMRGSVYHYLKTGYDAAFAGASASPGTALLMYAVRDLIENAECNLLDLGYEEDWGYKRRFGTRSYATHYIECCRRGVSRGQFLRWTDMAIHRAKTLVRRG